MMHKILSALLITTSLAGMLAVANPTPVSAACGRLLTFPTWYKGLTTSGCELKDIGNGGGKVPIIKFVVTVLTNIIEMILQLVGYVAVAFIIIGGFQYITSAGDSGHMANAKKTILNASVGLVISIFSVAIVNVVAGAL